MKTAIVYHNRDWDGYMSAAITLMATVKNKNNPDTITEYGWNYGMPIPDLSGYDTVYILDVCFPAEQMRRLAEKTEVIWIDHHVSSFEKMEKSGALALLRNYLYDQNYSACQLTWNCFHDTPPSRIVNLFGEYDIFNKSGRFEKWEDILSFQMYARTVEPTVLFAADLLEDEEHYDITDEITRWCSMGETILKYKRSEALRAWKTDSVRITGPQGEKGLLLFTNDRSSLMTEALFTQHGQSEDIDFVLMAGIRFDRDTEPTCKVSIRVPEWSGFDASAFAALHGGGGHRRAAGCQVSLNDLKKYMV